MHARKLFAREPGGPMSGLVVTRSAQ
jgi:hypothetical protein